MKYALSFAATGLIASPALAAGIDLTIAIPQLKVAEYHRPYVAIWLEQPGQPFTKTLSAWYDVDLKGSESGTKWLVDVRTWWRKSGRTMKFPAAGVSSATRAPGPQKISFTPAQIGALKPGNYELVVEAAREVGGRELLRLPFAWPPKAPQTARATGKTELGAVSALVKP